jgi:hypothetical protein
VDNLNGVSKIVPALGGVGELNLEIMADVDPAQFPHGLELVLFAPGSPVPLGRGVVRRGCMVCVIPPEPAKPIREARRRMLAQQVGPGETKGPGL